MSANKESVTGRDVHIMCNALAYAIVTIEALPERQQEWSNKEDMKRLLAHLAVNYLGVEYFMDGAIAHISGVAWRESVQ